MIYFHVLVAFYNQVLILFKKLKLLILIILKILYFINKYGLWNIVDRSYSSFASISLSRLLTFKVFIVSIRQAWKRLFRNYNFLFLIVFIIQTDRTFYLIIIFQKSINILIVLLKSWCWLGYWIWIKPFLIVIYLWSRV